MNQLSKTSDDNGSKGGFLRHCDHLKSGYKAHNYNKWDLNKSFEQGIR